MTNNHIFVPHNYVYSEHTFNAVSDKTRVFVVFEWKEELVKAKFAQSGQLHEIELELKTFFQICQKYNFACIKALVK